jgi:hypothetical protein
LSDNSEFRQWADTSDAQNASSTTSVNAAAAPFVIVP